MEENQKLESSKEEQQKFRKSIWKSVLKYAVVILTTAFVTLWISGISFEEIYVDFLIRSYYDGEYDKNEVTENKLTGLVSGLKDKHSYYISKELGYELFNEDVTQVYGGIGVEIRVTDDEFVVSKVFDDGPAERAGIKKDDIIVRVGEFKVAEMTLEDLTTNIRGKVGTIVKVGIKRGEKELAFDVKRETINAPTVTATMKDNNIGYIEISQFDADTDVELALALKNLDGAEKLIIDLRNNPGGLFNVVLRTMNMFVEEDKTMVIAKYRNEEQKYVSEKGEKNTMPMAVLINRASASSSEIFSACMKDNKRAYIIGEKSYGKGSIQRTFILPENAGMNLTIGHFYSPLGNKIDGVGVVPDLNVEQQENNDNVLQAAIKYLNGIK
ncbi:MAG: S41 family peptidase [Clostridia bacterium]|nr:S41 family peptidase [Clostridia bacterium]